MTEPGEVENPAGEFENPLQRQEVESYGIHRYSTATRLMVTFVVVALVTAAIFAAVQSVMAFMRGSSLEPAFFWAMSIAAALAIISATLVGRYSARGITKPIAKITDTVSEIKAGSYSARTGFTGYDEIGRLGSTLDEMAGTIERNAKYQRQITIDVAHELRTPLMAMQANLEAMIDGVLTADTERLITVNSEVLRLGRLVEAQLKLSRLEARVAEFYPATIDLGELTSGLISNYELLAEGSGLTLAHLAEAGIMIYADPDLIRQMTANLVSNAIRYTPEGGHIEVVVARRGNAASLEVTDTGIGIDKADLEDIFKKFHRAGQNKSNDVGGLGIGLALVREIVDIHRGEIAVQSEVGRGSSFVITLPLVGA